MKILSISTFAAILINATSGCSQTTSGFGATELTGSTAGSTSANANSILERCAAPLGTIAVDDGQDENWYSDFRERTGVASMTPLIRQAAQQSNCFVVTSAGSNRLSKKFQKFRETQRSDEFREGSNVGKGQTVVTDYFLEPSVLYASSDVGGALAGIGSSLGGFGEIGLGVVGLAANTTETNVTMSLFDIRAGIQVSASQGSSSTSELGGLLGGLGGNVGLLGGGYSRTPEGKQTVAAFIAAYNGMVIALRNYQTQEIEGGLGKGGQLKVGS